MADVSMKNLTFDTNCLVDLELYEGAVDELRRLVTAHDAERITINVPGIGASERLTDGTFARSFSLFENRLRKLANREFEILKPPIYWDIAYFDWAILGGDETIKLEQQIHVVLFPETHFEWSEHAMASGLDPNQAAMDLHKEWIKWRNRKCDTLARWCHVFYEKDIFVTRDGNFHKTTKKRSLEQLGAKRILYPDQVFIKTIKNAAIQTEPPNTRMKATGLLGAQRLIRGVKQ